MGAAEGSRVPWLAAGFLIGYSCAAGADFLFQFYWGRKKQRILPSPLASVKESTAQVVKNAEHVTISSVAISDTITKLFPENVLRDIKGPTAYDKALHLVDGTWRTAQYMLVVDALNFCFWPAGQGLQYEHLAMGLKEYVSKHGIESISAARLSIMTVQQLRSIFGWSKEVPLETERVRLLQEADFWKANQPRQWTTQVGRVLQAEFGGKASNLIRRARGSAVELVRLVVAHFPGFRDHSVYKGQLVYFYKRAQIFVADIYGAFGGKGLGRFHDIDQLTMFADYRVPVVLCNMGIIKYSAALKSKVMAKQQLPSGSAEEVEIRAATIQAVELLRDGIAKKYGGELTPLSIQLDWWLWELGERNRANDEPHHCTLTPYY